MIKVKIRTIKAIVIAISLFAMTFISANLLTNNTVDAYSCNGSCSGGAGTCAKYCSGKCCLWHSTGSFNCNVHLSSDEYYCNSGPSAGCTCNNGHCKTASGGVCTNVGQVCSCSCTPKACPPEVKPTKFMTSPRVTTYGVSCSSGGCDGTSYACPPVYFNNPPTCAFLPTSVTMTREDSPKQVQFTATDNDYGDNVSVTAVQVKDSAGLLNSCVKATVLGGGDLLGATVKNGSDTPGDISKSTSVLLDPREAHGVFENIGGKSLCSGFLIVQVTDSDSDAGGPDTADSSTCKIAVSIENKAPQLSNVALYDRDTREDQRDTGNLIDGRDQVFVGAAKETTSKFRAYMCTNELASVLPVLCPQGAQSYFGKNNQPLSQIRNPLDFEFTVTDENGADDIMQAGIWIQRVSQNENSAVLPPVSATDRNSIQALYSEKENIQVTGTGWHFVSRACLGESCGPKNLQSSSKQIFSSLAFISQLGETVTLNGNIQQGKFQSATQREWQRVGFPDCLNTTAGCSAGNIPANAKLQATTTAKDVLSNYAWSIAADENHLICFKQTDAVPTVIDVTTPVVCPSDCAACARREGVFPVANDPKAMTFKFGLYFNDKDSPQGMPAGEYSIFVSALDKVSAPINNVVGKGNDGWAKFDKSGKLCTGATCPNDSAFSLLYDPVAPTVDKVTWNVPANKETEIIANIAFSDKGSGIAGVTNEFMARQDTLDGEPSGERTWAVDANKNPIDGKNIQISLPTTAKSVEVRGYGLDSGEILDVGLCVYDRAGNMGCGKNPDTYVYLGPWIKTSYGDIYSNKSASGQPFVQSMPNNDGKAVPPLTDITKNLYAPYTEQIFTLGTGLIMTGGNTGLGVTGGYQPTAGGTQYQMGFKSNYRVPSSIFNIFSYAPTLPGNEFEKLRAIANLNCDLMNSTTAGTCQTGGTSIIALGGAPINVVSLKSGTIDTDILCSKTNVIFVQGDLTISSNVVKDPGTANSGCIFVVAGGNSLTISDVTSDKRKYSNPPVAGEKGQPTVDKFEAAIVASTGAKVAFTRGTRGGTTKSIDRLEIKGWVYSSDMLPTFKRYLAPVDNKRFPSEYIIYDASLLDVFRPLLGYLKTVDLTCGTSSHVLCK